MKGARKNLKRAAKDRSLSLQHGQNIMQVLSLRGSNLIEVMDARGDKSPALFPAKFQKSMWMKRDSFPNLGVNIVGFGHCRKVINFMLTNQSFIVVDESGKERALESGSKVACVVSQVLFYVQVRALQKSPEWPEIFKSSNLDGSIENDGAATSESLQRHTLLQEVKNEFESSDDDDGLPPLEANLNRIKPFELQSDRESDSGSDTD